LCTHYTHEIGKEESVCVLSSFCQRRKIRKQVIILRGESEEKTTRYRIMGRLTNNTQFPVEKEVYGQVLLPVKRTDLEYVM
jgi:hypothetical protein